MSTLLYAVTPFKSAPWEERIQMINHNYLNFEFWFKISAEQYLLQEILKNNVYLQQRHKRPRHLKVTKKLWKLSKIPYNLWLAIFTPGAGCSQLDYR